MKKLLILALAVILSALTLTSCSGGNSDKPDSGLPSAGRTAADEALITEGSAVLQLQMPEEGEDIAVITTSFGVIKARFFPEAAPMAVQNFKELAASEYYNGVIFHRVIPGFMIQGGDPLGTGYGGQSIWGEPFATEIDRSLHHIRGALAMAKGSSSVSQGSQFYIVQGSEPTASQKEDLAYYSENQEEVINSDADLRIKDFFPQDIIDKYLEVGGYIGIEYQYTVFGQVFEGIEVVDAIAAVETIDPANRNDKPVEDVVILSITIEKYHK